MTPWTPELFSAPALERILERRRRERLVAVPFFDGIRTEEHEALTGSFLGEPELHHPVRGRIKGAPAFERFVTETKTWMTDRDVSVEDTHVFLTPQRGIEEVVLHVDGDRRRIALPVAVATDHDDTRLIELRVYYSTWPLGGGRTHRPPLLQPDAGLRAPDVVGDYQRALAAGDVDGALAAFAPGASVRGPAGDADLHQGADALRALHERCFADGRGVTLEACAVTDDGRSCALEYTVAARDGTPHAGIAVFVRGADGPLAAARSYDDAGPPCAIRPPHPTYSERNAP